MGVKESCSRPLSASPSMNVRLNVRDSLPSVSDGDNSHATKFIFPSDEYSLEPPRSFAPSRALLGNNAFVANIRTGRTYGTSPLAPRSCAISSVSTATSTAAMAAHRVPLECLAPGGKVGRQKVSLERAVTSIAQPKPESKQEQETEKATKTKRATQLEDAPMYKVILIGDEEYNREHVVLSIQDIVPDTDNTRAAEIFEEAQKAGQALCGVYPEEQAELYVEQFTRCEPMIYADMEKEDAIRPNGAK